LRSRFDNIIEFEDYDTNQLLAIAKLMLKKQNIEIETEAEKHLLEFFEYHHKNKNMYFGNARFVRKIIDQAMKHMYIRLADLPPELRTDKMLKEVKLEDVKNFKSTNDLIDREKQQMGFSVR
jgi:hypothetical protein